MRDTVPGLKVLQIQGLNPGAENYVRRGSSASTTRVPGDRLAGGVIAAAVGIPGVGKLHPNYPLEHYNSVPGVDRAQSYSSGYDFQRTLAEWDPHPTSGMSHNRDTYHTLVYQFKVKPEHESVNALGDWFQGGPTKVRPFNVRTIHSGLAAFERNETDGSYREYHDQGHSPEYGFRVPWSTHTELGAGLNTFLDVSPLLARTDRNTFDTNRDGLVDYLPPTETYNENNLPHLQPPTYNTEGEFGLVYYPRVNVPAHEAVTPEIVEGVS